MNNRHHRCCRNNNTEFIWMEWGNGWARRMLSQTCDKFDNITTMTNKLTYTQNEECHEQESFHSYIHSCQRRIENIYRAIVIGTNPIQLAWTQWIGQNSEDIIERTAELDVNDELQIVAAQTLRHTRNYSCSFNSETNEMLFEAISPHEMDTNWNRTAALSGNFIHSSIPFIVSFGA